MRFCMVTSFYPPYNFGGDGIFIQRLATALAQRGHEVTVVHCIDAYRASGGATIATDEPAADTITVHSIRHRAGLLSTLITHQFSTPGLKARALRRIFEQQQFDVVHFHNISLIGGAGVLRYGSGIKLYTAHEYWLVCPLSTLWKYGRERCEHRACVRCTLRARRPPQWWRFGGRLRNALREMDALLAPSEFMIRKHAEMGMALDFTHLPNFLPPATTAGGDLTIDRRRPFFLMAGRLEDNKGFHKVIEAFRDFRDADLVIAGSGQFEARLRELAADSPHIHFTGHLPYASLLSYYHAARALIVPSLWDEPFGLIVLEAFSQSTPVIVHHAGALPELVQASDGGLVYTDEAGLLAAVNGLLRDPDRAGELGRHGHRAYRENWTDERHLERYLGIIEEIRARKAPAESG